MGLSAGSVFSPAENAWTQRDLRLCFEEALAASPREFEYRHNLRKQPLQMIELLLQAFPKVRVEVQEPSAFDPKSEP
jgi:hypothetical protein